jgi:DNA-binding Xre family transcriptional regulator
MVNINKLKGKIVEKELSVEKLAEKIGIDRSTLYRKMSNNGETFTIKEANLICKVLELNIQEASNIFFNQNVA